MTMEVLNDDLFSEESQEDLLKALAEEIESRKVDSKGIALPLFQWRPRCAPWHPKGNLEYQKLLPYCRCRIMVVTTANRGGKTMTGAVMTAGRARGQHPLFTDVKYEVPQNIWVGCPPKFVKQLFRTIMAFIPRKDIKQTYWSSGEERVELTNGSIIKMKSYGQPREEWQMEEVNFLWLDEEPKGHLWDEAMMRLNAPDSQCLVTATLVNASPFIFDIARGFDPDRKNALEAGEKDANGDPVDVAWFSSKMEDNDTLDERYIAHAKYINRKDPDMYKIRVLGEPTELAGKRIFREALPNVKSAISAPVGTYWFNEKGRAVQVDKVSPLAIDVYELPIPGMRYVIGSDIAEGGATGDWTTAHVICCDSSKVVAKFQGKLEPGPWGKNLAWMGYWYGTATVNWEMNMQGAAIADRLDQMHYPRIAMRETFSGKTATRLQSIGFRTDGNSKHAIISELRDALGDGVLHMPDHDTYEELKEFGYLRREDDGFSRSKGMSALRGHDDLVMSLAITWYTTRFAPVLKPSEIPKTWAEDLEDWTIKKVRREARSGLSYDGL